MKNPPIYFAKDCKTTHFEDVLHMSLARVKISMALNSLIAWKSIEGLDSELGIGSEPHAT